MLRFKTIFAALALIAVSAAPAAAQADKRNFFVVNATNYPIKFVGVNPPGDEVWNENEVEGTLAHGGIIKVVFGEEHKGCTWNIKVTWADDNTSSFFRNLDLCKVSVVALRYNRQTDTASYASK